MSVDCGIAGDTSLFCSAKRGIGVVGVRDRGKLLWTEGLRERAIGPT